ncbi:MAG: AI-2E family transporter [Balneolaceae bacterium]|nr:MAG: AI-2E family transporter [Balneolaceae bacterium]
MGIILGILPADNYATLFFDTLLMPLLVILVFTTVQLLESSFLTPRIIGSKVSNNPFMAIIVLLLGAKAWRIAGMILSIPLIGIMRIGFSQVHEFKPYGYLLVHDFINTVSYRVSRCAGLARRNNESECYSDEEL